jgi:hypothetical protein
MATTKLLTKQAGNATLDAVFDPYVQGTSPAATGLLNDSGVDIASNIFAPILYGTAAAATGLLTEQSGNADISTLFAAHGTATYGLPINGNSYTATVHNTGTTNSAQLSFITNNSAWSVNDFYGGGTIASGSIPTGAVSVMYSYTVTSGTPTSISNPATSLTALTASNLSFIDSTSNTGSGAPGKGSVIALTIKYANSGGAVISTTTINFDVSVPPIP